jgi:hypothetical protein
MQKKEIPSHPDKHIDQDFPGYPHLPSKENIINPKSKIEKATAALDHKDGKKINKHEKPLQTKETDEQDSDGSGGAFSGTEELIDDEE